MSTLTHAGILSLSTSYPLMVEQLHQLCAINSGTENTTGLAIVQTILSTLFKPLADDIDLLTLPEITSINLSGETVHHRCGSALYVRKRPHLTRRVLLSGHMDTVFDVHHPFQSLIQIDSNRLNGPGVADMKGGLIVMLHALSAFETLSCSNELGWDVLITADEEIGSPASSTLFADLASRSQAALVYEPAMNDQGLFAKNRKGSGKLTLIATGIAAHAGRAFDEGRNAICYLAEIIIEIHKLNGQREGVTINVGQCAGGRALNVVPDKAIAKLDVRITQPSDEQWVRQKLDAIASRFQRPGYSLSCHGHFDRPVKRITPQTNRLFQRIQRIGHTLTLNLDWQDSGGCCDGNNFSAYGLPVIDTLGVRGGNIHSSKEYILLDSLVERATLSTLLLADLAQGGLEELTLP